MKTVRNFLKWYWDQSIKFCALAIGISASIFFSGIWLTVLFVTDAWVKGAFIAGLIILVIALVVGIVSMLNVAFDMIYDYVERKRDEKEKATVEPTLTEDEFDKVPERKQSRRETHGSSVMTKDHLNDLLYPGS